MKKISNKLFREFEINKNKQQNVIGGLASYNTSVSSDTNVSGGGYDISFNTLDGNGNSVGIDTPQTNSAGSKDTTDKPGC